MNNELLFWQTFADRPANPTKSFDNDGSVLSDPTLSSYRRRHYYLNPPYEGQYLTRREAECLLLMLRGYTNLEAAHYLSLSSRTVEYYLKNIRNKLNCFSKIHLLREIQKTNFLDIVDFELPPLPVLDE